jgi:quercetin dioxygenase-like cupin family protein
MKNLNRRDLCTALSAFAALGAVLAESPLKAHAESTAEAGLQAHPTPAEAAATGPDGKLSRSVVFNYNQLPVANYANGGSGRHVLSGYLPTGEFVEVHETLLPAGQMPHPPHKHPHSEFVMIREGELEFLNNGHPEPVHPGAVIFTASNIMHGLKNIGTTTASYFVVAVGVQTKES